MRRTAAPFVYEMASNRCDGFLRALRLDRDRMGRRERVEVERARVVGDEVAPVAPLGIERGGRLLADERGERFVQPEIGPPAHRDEVAPPHVGELVRGGAEDPFERLDRCVAVVGREKTRAVRDRAGVLHRARLEVGDADRVDLYVGVRDGGVVLQPLDRAHVRVARVDALLGEAGRKAHADRHARRRRHGRRELVRADRERDEVRRDLRCLRGSGCGVRRSSMASWEAMGMFPIAAFPAGWISSSEKRGLELGLVEAGERAPRVGRFELRRGVALLAAERSVQAAQRVADPALPRDLEDVLAGRNLAREVKGRGLRLRVPLGAFELVLAVDRRADDVELDGVEE